MRTTTLAALAVLGFAGCGDKDDDTGGAALPREGTTDGGSFYVFWDSVPDPIPFNEGFALTVMVHDGADHSTMLSDVDLAVDATMPEHGHGMTVVPEVTANGDGSFIVDGMLFHMAGDWELQLWVTQDEVVESVKFDVPCCEG